MIAGGVVAGSIVLAALYDYISRRRGRGVAISASDQSNADSVRMGVLHDELNHY